MRPISYRRASGLGEAIESRSAHPSSEYIAGGTSLLDLVKLDVMRPDRVIDVNGLPLDGIEQASSGGLLIGATVRNSDLAWDERVKRRYAALSEAILSGASPQLRNMATTAGNLMQRTRCPYFRDNFSPCNKREPGSGCAAREGYNRAHAILGGSSHCIATHASDMCVALALFDAVVVTRSSDGERRIPMEAFHLLPADRPDRETQLEEGELIVVVELPKPVDGLHSLYRKIRDRESYEFASASVAAAARVEAGGIIEARLALGGIGTKPWRCRSAEESLIGREPSRELFERVADEALEGAELLEHNAFKAPLAKRVVIRALEELCSR